MFLSELCKCCGMEFGWVLWLGIVVRGGREVVGVIGVEGFGFDVGWQSKVRGVGKWWICFVDVSGSNLVVG